MDLKRWDAIFERVSKSKTLYGAEIGVWQGKLSEKLLAMLPMLHLTMVDRWTPPDETDSYFDSGSEIARKRIEEFDRARELTFEKTKAYLDRRDIRIMESGEAAKSFLPESFDFVFLDGDHSYAGVKKDIESWIGKVKKGGWIGGHDFDHPDQGQVKEAVLECFPGAKIDLGYNRTWFVWL